MTHGEWAFAFVDLAGFTALTEAHGDEEAADYAKQFYELAQTSMMGSSDLVKRIGDAVLLAADSSSDAVSTVFRLMAAIDGKTNFPLVRAGLHFGSAVRSFHDGRADYLGSGVNVAARVTAEASGRQVLLTETVARALDETTWQLRGLGPMQFRSVPRPIEVYELILSTSHDGDMDPVCKMRVSPGHVLGCMHYHETDYVFCSLACVRLFAAHPDRYAVEHGAATPGNTP